eukprot:symbB.v1.2.021876.t1/scaffold1871.1/size142957/2
MGNQCCCDEDTSARPVDPNVLVWRPEPAAGKRLATAAELQKRDEQLDAALDRIARQQPDEPSPRQSVPRAAEVAEFRRSQLQEAAAEATPAERCFLEARGLDQMQQPPQKIGEDNDSTDGLGAPSDTSRPMGEVPQHEVQWVFKYEGDAVGAHGARDPSVSPLSPVPPLPAGSALGGTFPSNDSVAAEAHATQRKRLSERKQVAMATEEPPAAKTAPLLPPPTATAEHAPVKDVAPAAAKPAKAQAAVPPSPKAERETPQPFTTEEEDDIPLLPMRFQLPDKSFQDVYFFAFPIGFDLGKKTPLTVRSVKEGSYAEQLGVQAGWKICQIGGVEVSHLQPKEMMVVLSEQKKKHLG